MPESPEVKIMMDNLNRLYSGHVMNKLNICSGTYKLNAPDGYNIFKRALPLKIDKFNSKGKFIWISFKKSLWTIHISLGLTGHFRWNGKTNHCHFHFHVSKGSKSNIFYLEDQRNFGKFKFVKSDNVLEKKLNSLGMDLLQENITNSEFIETLGKIRNKNKEIGKILLDQKYFSGVGNYIRAEALYVAKISPYRELSSIDDNELITLKQSIIHILKKSYKKQTTNGLHSYKFLVYGKRNQKDDDGYDIIGERYEKDRTIWWVPDVQF
jgi:formamidopyrimidine-DNA glycosylase